MVSRSRIAFVFGVSIIFIGSTLSAFAAEPPVPPKAPAAASPVVPPAAQPPAVKTTRDPKAVVALVGGKEIHYSDLQDYMKKKPQAAAMMAQARTPEMTQQIERAMLNGLVDRQLLLDEVSKTKTTVPPEKIEQTINEMRTKTGGQEGLERQLQMIGLTFDQFKSELSTDLAIDTYINTTLMKGAKPSEEDLKKEYEAHKDTYSQPAATHVRHILVKTSPEAKPDELKKAEEKANMLYKKVTTDKADFAEVAKHDSDCPSAPQGGDLGFIEKGKTVPEFEVVALALKPGEISKPVKSRFGYHIIKAEETRAAVTPDFAAVKDQIAQRLEQQQKMDVIQKRLAELRKDAKVEIKL